MEKEILPIEKQVTSLERSKRIKELGFPQDGCQWYWVKPNHKEEFYLRYTDCLDKGSLEYLAAPTVAEWGEILPKEMGDGYYLTYVYAQDIWLVDYIHHQTYKRFEFMKKCYDTEYSSTVYRLDLILADACAKVWECLKTNNLLESKDEK